MKKKQFFVNSIMILLGMAMLVKSFSGQVASAAGKVVLSSKKITVQTGNSKILRLKNNKAKVTWSIKTGKKYITLAKKTKKSVKITAVKKGTAKVQAKVGDRKYTCKVVVLDKNKVKRNAADIAAVKKIIEEQKSLGAYHGIDNLDDGDRYFWDADGRLTKINWTNCDLKGTLSVAGLPALMELYCSGSQIQKLDVSKNNELTVLACGDNELTALDVSRNIALRELYCYGNQLTEIDIHNNKELVTFSCHHNLITDIDVSNQIKLLVLDCNTNHLRKLDTSRNILLRVLHCHKNQITDIDVGNNQGLTELACNDNQLMKLDLENNLELEALYCGGNQLRSLDISANVKLETLSCRSNYIIELDISKNDILMILECDYDVEVKG